MGRDFAERLAARQRAVTEVYSEGFRAGEEHGFIEGVKAGLKLIEERATSLSEAPETARGLYDELSRTSGGAVANTIQGLRR